MKSRLHPFNVLDDKIQLIESPKTEREMRKIARESFMPYANIASALGRLGA